MNLLSIGGSDPSTGAGIQADVKTFSSLGAYPLTVVTAITSQNTSSFSSSQPISKKIIEQQISSLFSDFKINGIKIGMVYNSTIIKTLQKRLQEIDIPIILDPVIKSTTGGNLLEKSALSDFKKLLIPLCNVITPNKKEAELLTRTKITTKRSLLTVAKKIQKMGVKNVIITGIEQKGNVIDFVLEKDLHYEITGKKIVLENHGSGCTYSAALLFSICKEGSVKQATKFAKRFTFNSIKNAKKIGVGIPITITSDDNGLKNELTNAINIFEKIPKIYEMIPECQTNFVYSMNNPKTINDVLGVLGRIVKIGKNVTRVGNLDYGASKHVATALIEVNKKHNNIRSAINLRYHKNTISRFKKNGFCVLSYDRSEEPKTIKKKGSSVKWGIKSVIEKSKQPPDVIYHLGDFGKEAMILVFAESPKKIIEKITKVQ